MLHKWSVPATCLAFVNVVVLVTTTFAPLKIPDMPAVIGRRNHAAVLLCSASLWRTDPSFVVDCSAVLFFFFTMNAACSPPFTSNTANLLVLLTTKEPFACMLVEVDWSNGDAPAVPPPSAFAARSSPCGCRSARARSWSGSV